MIMIEIIEMKAKTTRALALRQLGAGMVLVVSVAAGVLHAGQPRYGEAVIVNKVGDAHAYLIDGPVHEGHRRRVDLFANSSVGETARVGTGRDGRLCMALSPGAVVCVAPGSDMTFQQLRMSADGLPPREEDVIRRIYINLHKGRILVHAGAPVATLDIRIRTDAGDIRAGGGTFSVARQKDGSWVVFNDAFVQTLDPGTGNPLVLAEKQTAAMRRQPDGTAVAWLDESLADSPLRAFDLCEVFFKDIEPFLDDPLRFDREGLAQSIGGTDSAIRFVGGDIASVDVSPSFRPVAFANVRPRVDAADHGGRWGKRRIWDWYNSIGPQKGFNYVPRYAVNTIEMWQAGTFDEDVISEELGWAHEAGYTSVRVQLQYLVWKTDEDGFMARFKRFAELAQHHGLKVTPVLFDDLNIAGIEPVAGLQPNPVPGEHNSRWTACPGEEDVQDRAAWPNLERYVRDLIGTFKRDDRILFWDLYNRVGDGGLGTHSLPLMSQTFNWARDINPSQPLAVATWGHFDSAIGAWIHERSDLVTFHNFDSAEIVEPLLLVLARLERPMICTAWLMRQRDNTFETILPVFAVHRVGWFNCGLVNGKTQTWIQQAQFRSDSDPDLWQHDVFRSDGEAYNQREVEQIKAFRFMEAD